MFNKENFSNFVKKTEKYKETDEMSYIEKETREEIMDFQEEKEQLINQMHELLQKADAEEEISFEEKDLISVGINEYGNYQTFGKKSGEITKGDISIASIWDKNLKLNSEIDRKTKKEFILNETRRKIQEIWDRQLVTAAGDSKETAKINAFNGLQKSAESEAKGKYEKMSPGHLAEKMVNSFFTKLLTNNPDFPFTIEQADVYDDVQDKIDFYFHIKDSYTRALGVDSCGDDNRRPCLEQNNIGVQYTMNNKEDVQRKKLDQIEKAKTRKKDVDDIVLVTVPLSSMFNALKEWKENKKNRNSFSGPERYLKDTEKEKLFKLMLDNLPSGLNINPEEYWEKIKNQV